jgi:glycosyltransferase involved in cell wall biosynthesis
VRDAIVYSGWTWKTFNVPERIALALTHLGARVLYCGSPVSVFRQADSNLHEVEPGIFAFRPVFAAERLNRLSLLQSIQARVVAKQILVHAASLELSNPIFFYPCLGDRLSLLSHFRNRFLLVHIQMDYGERSAESHVRASDITLAIPHSVYHQQRARFGDKVQLIPQVLDLRHFQGEDGAPLEPSPTLASIPHPRLGYLGPAHQQVNKPLINQLLQLRPDWHFVSVGPHKALPLPNVHAVPWQSNRELGGYARGFDVGFMPYDCFDEEKLHCLPLKLFEYFALGLPVVATPILELREFGDLVYFGDTARELEQAIKLALQESPDSPKRRRRIEIARNHSIENLADALSKALPFND